MKKRSSHTSTLKQYYKLTKPGIIRGNLLSTIAGFFLASQLDIDGGLLGITVVGTALVIASACVFNNILDRDIDRVMERTRSRATASGTASLRGTLLFGSVLGFVGLYLLSAYVNPLTALVGAIGMIMYVIVYGIAKRASIHGTLIGSISGAIPPLAGYTAVTNQLDVTALILFLVLVAWQMPHFYAIAVFRAAEYKKASIPVLPLKRSFARVYRETLLYTLLFLVASVALATFSEAGEVYALTMVAVSLWWLTIIAGGIGTQDTIKWAKNVFGASLLVLLVWCAAIIVDVFI